MRRKSLPALGMIAAVAATGLAAGMYVPINSDAIEIEVSLAELQECQETLAHVLQPPDIDNHGRFAPFDPGTAQPSVRCVVTEV